MDLVLRICFNQDTYIPYIYIDSHRNQWYLRSRIFFAYDIGHLYRPHILTLFQYELNKQEQRTIHFSTYQRIADQHVYSQSSLRCSNQGGAWKVANEIHNVLPPRYLEVAPCKAIHTQFNSFPV